MDAIWVLFVFLGALVSVAGIVGMFTPESDFESCVFFLLGVIIAGIGILLNKP